MLTDPAVLGHVLDAVVEQELLLAPHRVPAGTPGAAALEGRLEVQGRSATVKLILPADFPLSFPLFILQPWDALGFIPHVEANGYVCYVAAEGLLLDRRDPVAIVAEAIRRASKLLADGVTGANRSDFVDEFESYWNRLPGGVGIDSVLDPGAEVRQVIRATPKEGPSFLTASEADISSFYHGASVGGQYTSGTRSSSPLRQAPCWCRPAPTAPCGPPRKPSSARAARVDLTDSFTGQSVCAGCSVCFSD